MQLPVAAPSNALRLVRLVRMARQARLLSTNGDPVFLSLRSQQYIVFDAMLLGCVGSKYGGITLGARASVRCKLMDHIEHVPWGITA
jgi:hypothetical protein